MKEEGSGARRRMGSASEEGKFYLGTAARNLRVVIYLDWKVELWQEIKRSGTGGEESSE